MSKRAKLLEEMTELKRKGYEVTNIFHKSKNSHISLFKEERGWRCWRWLSIDNKIPKRSIRKLWEGIKV